MGWKHGLELICAGKQRECLEKGTEVSEIMYAVRCRVSLRNDQGIA